MANPIVELLNAQHRAVSTIEDDLTNAAMLLRLVGLLTGDRRCFSLRRPECLRVAQSALEPHGIWVTGGRQQRPMWRLERLDAVSGAVSAPGVRVRSWPDLLRWAHLEDIRRLQVALLSQ